MAATQAPQLEVADARSIASKVAEVHGVAALHHGRFGEVALCFTPVNAFLAYAGYLVQVNNTSRFTSSLIFRRVSIYTISHLIFAMLLRKPAPSNLVAWT